MGAALYASCWLNVTTDSLRLPKAHVIGVVKGFMHQLESCIFLGYLVHDPRQRP